MKKIILGLICLSNLALATSNIEESATGNKNSVVLRVGGDMAARYSKSSEEKELGYQTDVKNENSVGTDFAFEYYRNVAENLDLGLGIGYQRHAKRKIISNGEGNLVEGGEYISVPVYVTAKINIPIESNIRPYLKFDLGLSINNQENSIDQGTKDGVKIKGKEQDIKMENGLYIAGGLGVDFYNTFDVDLMYALNKGRYHNSGETFIQNKKDNDYARIMLSAGYKFNF